ncbi:MAG: septal ring lytic transglycosylase RlpA family protein [Methanococcaceae archaeon]
MNFCHYLIISLLTFPGITLPKVIKKFHHSVTSRKTITIEPENGSDLEVKTGIASFYGKKHAGRKTSSGEIFNGDEFSASHKSYPFGTKVSVTNLSNMKSVIVKINDRLPRRNKRIIDISYKAAEELDMIRAGIAKVKIEVIQWGNSEFQKLPQTLDNASK